VLWVLAGIPAHQAFTRCVRFSFNRALGWPYFGGHSERQLIKLGGPRFFLLFLPLACVAHAIPHASDGMMRFTSDSERLIAFCPAGNRGSVGFLTYLANLPT